MDTEPMIVTVTMRTKKRKAPGIAAQELGLFEIGTYATLDVSDSVYADGYIWRMFSAGDEWWFSATGTEAAPDKWITVAPVEVPQEPPPVDPPTEPDPPPVDDARIVALEARVAELEALLAEMEAKIGNHYRAGFTWMLEGAETFGVSTLDVIGE